MNPAVDVATYLAAQGIGLTYGSNLFTGQERAVGPGVPADSVFIANAYGNIPERWNDPKVEDRFPGIHIRVRDGKASEAESRAQTIQDTLQGASISGYLDIESLGSSHSAAVTEGGHYRVSMTYRLTYTSDVR